MPQNPFADLIPQGGQPQGLPRIIQGPPREPEPRYPDEAQAAALKNQETVLNMQNTREQIAQRRQEATDKAAKDQNNRALATGHMLRILNNLDRSALDANDFGGGFGETGTSGSLMRKYGPEGTPAYDLQRTLDLPGALTAIDNLMEMRRNSPTGGAMGNVSDKDMQLMKDMLGIIDPNQSHGTFMVNMGEAKREILKNLRRIDPKSFAMYLRDNPQGIWITKDNKWHVGARQTGGAPARKPVGGNSGPVDLGDGWSGVAH